MSHSIPLAKLHGIKCWILSKVFLEEAFMACIPAPCAHTCAQASYLQSKASLISKRAPHAQKKCPPSIALCTSLPSRQDTVQQHAVAFPSMNPSLTVTSTYIQRGGGTGIANMTGKKPFPCPTPRVVGSPSPSDALIQPKASNCSLYPPFARSK